MNVLSTFGGAGLIKGVRKIAVLNPGPIGDFIVTLPAVHALKVAYPDAQLVYIGKAWHVDLLRHRPGPIDAVEAVPPVPGVGVPVESHCDIEKVEVFVAMMRERQFDLGFQMYGGGRYSNPFLKRLEPRITIGLQAEDAEPLDRSLPYIYLQNNRLRMLEVAALAGANTLALGQELVPVESDRRGAEEVLPALAGERLVVLHPGANDLRRRWPPECFAAVADALAASGMRIVLSGVESERACVEEVAACMRRPVVNLCGKLPLPALCGLLARARLMISNDTGPLHLALAIGTPSVGVYWFNNFLIAGPLAQRHHRAAVSILLHCPVCGAENVHSRCRHDVSFVSTVTAPEVLAMAKALLAQQG